MPYHETVIKGWSDGYHLLLLIFPPKHCPQLFIHTPVQFLSTFSLLQNPTRTAMDMDMDIPLPEELEWLEANSHLQDDYEEQSDFYPEEEEPPEEEPPPPQEKYQPNPQPSKPILSIPAKPTVPPHPKSQSSTDPPSVFTTHSNGQKRPRSDDSSAPESISTSSSGDKRSKIHIVEDPEVDEDWLRYSPPKDTNTDVVDQVIVIEEKFVSRYASEIDGDCFPVTGPGGDRVYAKIGRVERRDSSKKLVVQAQSEGLTLEPINVLLQRVEQEAFTKVLEASSEVQSDVTISKAPVLTEQLWVEKYAPNSFTELLSDEHTNREVLLWLKQWDSRVFGSEIRSTTDEVLSSLRQHSNIAQHKKISDRNYSRKYGGARFTKEAIPFSNNYNQENDNSKGIQELWSKKPRLTGPPEQKVLLLCGPPGLGKTTLAHVAAKHCGYHVVEINASDDRSASSIEPKILDVLQMNSVMADSKPKCLVIDEIDGALGDGKGAVEVILKMVLAEKKSDTGSQYVARDGQSGRISSKKGRKTASLSRPVICICNDLYAPALRPLRHVAKVHKFVQPTVSRVVSRLKYICNKEGLRTSSIALTALAQYTECDIRSCLNTLQFLNKKKEALNVMELSSQVVGRKDISKSVFDIWKEIFQKRKLKQERKSNNSSSSVYNEFDFLHSLVSSRGDYDLILDGIHENVLQLHYHDPVMQKTVKCLNSLGVSDLIHQYIMRTQQMPLLVYQPPIAITVHRLIAQAEKPNIEWPKSFQRCRTMLIEKMEILQSWHNKISPYISRHLSTKSFVEESVSPLLHILSPPTLRPVALHLLSEKEKNELEQLISTMVSYSITYKNVKFDPLSSNLRHGAVSDTPLLSFDPPIGDFINFKDYRSGHYVLALAMKQLLLHEVEKKKILQVSINRSMHLTNGCNKEDQALAREENSRVLSAKTNYAVGCVEKNTEYAKNKLNSRQSNSDISTSPGSRRSATTIVKLKSPGVIKKSSGPSNFFDRFRKSSSKGSQIADNAKQKTATAERDSRPLIFKFNEGFTNAIKRPVRIRDFLQ